MTVRLHDKIRHLLETTPGLTQRGLAERMGLDPAAVNRMLYGRRGIMAEEIPVIEAYLGRRLDLVPGLLPVKQAGAARRGVSDVAQAPTPDMPPSLAAEAAAALPPLVPVYALDGDRSRPIDFAPRHPQQAGIADAFAYYMPDDKMAPRYFTGELVYVHPGRPAEAQRDAVIVLKTGEVKIARLLRLGAEKIRLQQFNPAREKDLPRREVKALFAIVGRG